jgi:succinoglycan biosynthesis transport protein ExoP
MLDTPSTLRIVTEQRELADNEALPLAVAWAFVRRQKTVILTCLLVALGLAGLYIIIAPNRFTATAQLLTDTKRSDSPAAQYGLVDAAVVDSQIETIKSEKIAISVINKLHLTQDPEFSENGIVGRLLSALSFSGDDITSEQGQLRKTVVKFKRSHTVVRIGRSYVANILFTSKDPVKAALIANELANAYIEDQLDAKALTAERAGSWMQKRIDELKEQLGIAAQRLQQFDANVSATSEDQLNKDQQDQRSQLVQRTQSLRRAYETLVNLSRYSQSIEERSLPLTDARVVTLASAPFEASSPNILWAFSIALVVGGMVGCAAAWVRETYLPPWGHGVVSSGQPTYG